MKSHEKPDLICHKCGREYKRKYHFTAHEGNCNGTPFVNMISRLPSLTPIRNNMSFSDFNLVEDSENQPATETKKNNNHAMKEALVDDNNLTEMMIIDNGRQENDVDEMEKFILDDVGRHDNDVQQPQTMIIDDIRQEHLQQPVQHPEEICIIEEEMKMRNMERKDTSRKTLMIENILNGIEKKGEK